MIEKMLARLGEIQGRVLELEAMVGAMRAQYRPAPGHGTDPSGCVAVVVDPDGLPSRIEIRTGWQRQLAAEAMSSAVMLAFEQAVVDSMREWSDVPDARGQRVQGEGAGQGEEKPQSSVPQPLPLGSPREPVALAEEALDLLKAARSAGVAPPDQCSGSGGAGAVSVTFGVGGFQACSIDPQWVRRQGVAVVNSALAEALREARAVREDQVTQRRAETQRLNDLERDALATLVGFKDLTDLPERR